MHVMSTVKIDFICTEFTILIIMTSETVPKILHPSTPPYMENQKDLTSCFHMKTLTSNPCKVNAITLLSQGR